MKPLLDNTQHEELKELLNLLVETMTTIKNNNAGLASIINTSASRAMPAFLEKFIEELQEYCPPIANLADNTLLHWERVLGESKCPK